ncbi:hypothetical protein ULMS_21960 [Patiriisocius marinistellae]|uniref:Uncharacterized protein n=1 Tax=Patiriisocius marinistellae TaxID=2494560 RepID=A0A5J4FZ61_9FLAO|nr:FG-GAP-like repeat-containing protein [Patiriisocius marinistellae]GEQ86688.1 hypothetical protein ULMS_21960 [Patiriisocius marinistellae]
MKKLFILFIAISAFQLNGQIEFQENIITEDSEAFRGIYSVDLDGDGDVDTITTSIINSGSNSKISWYENLDGLGNFGPQQVIEASIIAGVLEFGDIDGDGDVDIIWANTIDDKIVWLENINISNNSFSINEVNAQNYLYRVSLYDIDDDGDLDILASYAISSFTQINGLLWYENLDGLGDFSEHYISAEDSTKSKMFDIDSDGDLDIVTIDFFDFGAGWHENLDGLGNFGPYINFSGLNYVTSVDFGDIDGDNDFDVLLSSNNGNNLMWYENTDGLGAFLPHIIIGQNVDSTNEGILRDVDNDGDLDIISVLDEDNDIVWYENSLGDGVFSEKRIITQNLFNIRKIDVGDFNGDGDIDICAVSFPGALSVVWYDNLGLTSNQITGMITLDTNLDGCGNIDDISAANLLVVADNGIETIASFTLSNGTYTLFPSDEGTYNVSIVSDLLGYYTSVPEDQDVNFIGVGNTEVADFCLEPIVGVSDLSISMYPITDSRPGFTTFYKVVFSNLGPTILSGTVILEYDDTKLALIGTTPSTASQTNNTLTFDYSNLNPFENRDINISFDVLPPPIVNINDVLHFTATVTPIVDDATEENNTFDFSQVVIGSYDPNDINVIEGEQILLEDVDKYLHYIIRFQNTGTAPAIFVIVENQLDENLDWSTLQIESTSHDSEVEIIDGNKVKFIFNAIYLPSVDTNEVGSNGHIAYRIKPKSDLVIGDIIPNTADIFFDFNLPITTNTATTTIVETILNIDENLKSDVVLYPIPAKDVLNIHSKTNILQIQIISTSGQLVLGNKNQNNIKTSSLERGLYFVKATDENGNNFIRKIMKY